MGQPLFVVAGNIVGDTFKFFWTKLMGIKIKKNGPLDCENGDMRCRLNSCNWEIDKLK